MTTEERAAQIAGYREMADFLEAHVDVPMPFEKENVYRWDRETFLKDAAALATHGGCQKLKENGNYIVRRMFGPISLDVYINENTVCTLVTPAVYHCPDSLLEAASEYAGVKP